MWRLPLAVFKGNFFILIFAVSHYRMLAPQARQHEKGPTQFPGSAPSRRPWSKASIPTGWRRGF
jgi:hypothetical protein